MSIKSRILFVFILLISVAANSQTQLVFGEVNGTWQSDTILVIDHIYVPDGSTLFINPGVKVIFDGHFRFDINGCIRATGTEDDSIIFSVRDTTSFSNFLVDRGGWYGLRFNNTNQTNDSSIFEYCRFQFGKAIGDSLGNFGGAIFIRNFNKVRLSDCLISNNYAQNRGGGLSGSHANIEISRCSFKNNQAGHNESSGMGGGIYFDYSMPYIQSSIIDNNYAYVAGGGISLWFTDPLIRNNVVSNNYGSFGGGANFFYCGNTHPVTGNLFTGNETYFFGAAMTCNATHHIMANNTIAGNHGGGGGGIFLNTSSFPTYINNIFWGNTAPAGGDQIYIWDTFSAPDFFYNDVEGGKEDFGGTGGVGSFIGEYENNIEIDPLFESIGEFFYQLEEGSPCINHGKADTTGLNLMIQDLAGNPRIVDNHVDIGAFEYPFPNGNFTYVVSSKKMEIYPNPFTTTTTIAFSSFLPMPTKLSIYNSSGKEIKSFKPDEMQNENLKFSWNGKDNSESEITDGIYFIKAFFSDTIIEVLPIIKNH